MRARWIPLFVLAAAVGVSCQTQPEAELLNDDDARIEQRRRRMNILVQEPDGQGGWQAAYEMTQEAFVDEARDHCLREVKTNSHFASCVLDTGFCPDEICEAHVEVCMAHLYLV